MAWVVIEAEDEKQALLVVPADPQKERERH